MFGLIASSACGGSGGVVAASAGSASPSRGPTASPRPTIPPGAVRFVTTPAKSSAVARVEEHLAVNLVNTDAVLTSEGVDGVLTLLADGSFAPDSTVTVDMSRLTSDEALRDKWLSLFGPQTGTFKIASFVPTKAVGLPAPLPEAGDWAFTLEGRLTIHGVTRPSSWMVRAHRAGRDLTGSATTVVHWGDFDMGKPQAVVTQVVSVSDDIRLELAFVGTQAGDGRP